MNRTTEKLCTCESERIGREFIENWSHYISLVDDSNERDMLSLVDLLDGTRINWQKSEAKCNMYESKMISLEKNVETLQKENEALHGLVRDCKTQLAHAVNGKKDVECELAEHKRIIEQMKIIYKDQNHNGLLAVNTSKSPSPGIDNTYDKSTIIGTHETPQRLGSKSSMETSKADKVLGRTVASLHPSETSQNHRASLKRRSRSHDLSGNAPIKEGYEYVPPKRSRNAVNETRDINENDSSGQQPSRSIRRKLSETESSKKNIHLTPIAETYSYARSNYDVLKPGIPRSWTHGENIESRNHRELKFHPVFEACDVCKKRFGITSKDALRCMDCNLRFHQQCRARAPLPCVPKMTLPKTPSKQKSALVYYCPDSHPFIPPLLIHCIVALERDRLAREGIYRLPGNDSAVTKLYNEFMTSRVVPNLRNVETETLTGCIKKFLRELRDQLIPATSFDEFMKAIGDSNDEAVIQSVLDLPAPNRDTLAYFLLHLQKVAKNSNYNKMPIENLVHVLAPSVIGYSKLHAKTLENANELSRTQYAILLQLTRVPSEFWNRFITHNMSAVLAAEARTPGSKAALLTVTPTRSATRNERSETIMEVKPDDSQQPTTNSSPLIQPLSMASTTMRGIYFKDAF